MEILGLVLGSAAVGALVSSIVNGLFNRSLKKQELERQDMQMALKMAELKHQQLVLAHDWTVKQGGDAAVDFFDPLFSVIDYRKGMDEFRKTGKWAKGDAGHGRTGGTR